MSIQLFDRDLLKHRRERTARQGGRCDFLLERAAQEIADRLELVTREFPVALDLGAHFGATGRAIRNSAGVRRLISLEDCAVLLKECPGEQVSGSPEFLPFAPETFDLAVSALSLQFINDLPGALLQARRVLKPDGLFLAILPGGRTLTELREAFAVAEEEMEGGVSPRVAPFLDIRDGGALLQRAGFTLPVADSEILTVSYRSPFHLMKELQKMGASNVMTERRRTPLRRATLMRMAEIYSDRFGDADGRVRATFEFITLTGWSPHESQQKPLRPGTAQTRLAEALGVREQSAGEKAGNK